jgi:hypothetical protein
VTLHDDDERLHAAPDPLPGNWQENMFFVCWDASTLTGMVAHVQRAPAAGVQAAQVAVAVDGLFASATFTAPYRAGLLVPELYVRPVEPWRRWALELDGKGAAGPGPLGLLATEPGGETIVAAELTLVSSLPVADFAAGLAAVVDGMRADRPATSSTTNRAAPGRAGCGSARRSARRPGCSCGTTRGASATSTTTFTHSGRRRASTAGASSATPSGFPAATG